MLTIILAVAVFGFSGYILFTRIKRAFSGEGSCGGGKGCSGCGH